MIEIDPLVEGHVIHDPRIPAHENVVTRNLIDRLSREIPETVFVKFDDNEEEWTYAQFQTLIAQTALGLQQQGVGMGDHVLVWLPNGREHIRVFFALNYLGAVYVPINTAYRGHLLEHAIDLSNAKLAVVHASLSDRLAAVETAKLQKLILCGGAAPTPLRSDLYEDVLLPISGRVTAPPRRIEPWDPMAIIFTSGTTGPSKAVLASYLHLYTNAGPETWPFVTSEDRYLISAPMSHIGGMAPMFVMLVRGASFALVERFDTSTYWESVNRTRSTLAFLLGVMATFLEKQAPKPTDRHNTLKKVVVVPMTGTMSDFGERFGVDIYTIFNMTEVSSPIVSQANPQSPGTCGQPRPGVEVRLVDANDCEVPVGTVGEMIVRTDRPWAMNSGYYRTPEATAKAWRNGWFHTGDAFRRDGGDNFFFVDRTKDAIRRRGENISSMEVEAEVLAHPDIIEAAAIAVPSEFSEDEVMICVAATGGKTIDPAELIEFLKPRLAYFMVPRFVRTMAELPKTASAKIMKEELRKKGVTSDTWDRESIGDRLRAERF